MRLLSNAAILYFCLFVFSNCSQGRKEAFLRKIPFNTTALKVESNLRNAENSAEASKYNRCTSLDDILEIKRVVKLEINDQSALASIHDIVYLEYKWFVLDATQRVVMQFSEAGQFLGTLGRTGQGPGEYEQPYGLALWGKNLAILDNGAGKVLVYSSTGRYLKTIWTWKNGISLAYKAFFVGDRLYICDFSSRDHNVPNHAILDVSNSEWEVLWGFGKRFPLVHNYKKDKIHKWAFTAFNQIQSRIWVGSPYQNHLEIYDLDGRFLQEIPTGIDGMNEKDFKNVTSNRQMIEVFNSKPRIDKILYLEPLVFVFFSAMGSSKYNPSKVTVYDTSGKIICANLKMESFFHYGIRRGCSMGLVAPMDISYFSPEMIHRYITDQEFQRFLDAGFNINERADDNPYLLISGLKEI